MSFYQKMNIRQNCIEGNLLRGCQEEWERKRTQKLRVLKWDFMELRHDMSKYNEHFRSKVKRRKEEKDRRREQRKLEREASLLAEESVQDPEIRPLTPLNTIISPKPQASPNLQTRSQSATGMSRRPAIRANFGVRMGPEMMDELGLSGVEVPKLEASWGKVSKTVLSLHRAWNTEKNNPKRNLKSGKSDPGKISKSDLFEPPLLEQERIVSPDGRSRTATKSHQSYMQSCLAKPFSYEEFADKKISCRENEKIWMTSLRDPHPRKYGRFTASGEEQSLAQRQFSDRNIEKAKKVREEAPPPQLMGTHVSERITRMKFTSSKMLEERAELDRKAEEERLNTDKLIRRHKYMDKNITVDNIAKESPSYLRYRFVEPKEQRMSFSTLT